MQMARIALTFIKYPLAIGTYYEDAFRQTRHELITVCPYSGTWIPWKGGIHLPQKYAIPPDYQIPWEQRNWFSFAQAEELMGHRHIDVWISIDASYHLLGKPREALSVWIATDSHCVDYFQQRTQADLFFNVHTPYMQPGDIHLPVGYSPRWHYPVYAEEQYDVALLGLLYPTRIATMLEMARRGYRTYLDNGPCLDEARELYAKTKIIFSWSSQKDTVARVWEAMAFNKLLVANRTPDLEWGGRQEDIHYLGFDTMEEAIAKMEWALSHPDEASLIAQNGHTWVQPHTYLARVQKIFEVIGLEARS